MSSRRVFSRLARAFAPKERETVANAAGLRFTVISSRWNPSVTEALLASALSALESGGARQQDVEVIRVPGAFELPAASALAARSVPPPDAIVALGAIVRGETTHHEVLAHAVASALALLSTQVCPIGFGLLTCDSIEQALARSSKGREAAEAAIEMANLRRRPRRARRNRHADPPAVRSHSRGRS